MVDPPRPAGTARQWQIAHGQAAVDWMRSSGVARRMLDDVCQAVETVPGGRRSYRQVLGGSSALADARTLRPPWRFRSPAGSRSMSRRSRSPTHVCLQYQRSVSPVERRARSCRIAVQQGSQGGLTLISVFLPEVDNGLVRYNRGPGPAVKIAGSNRQGERPAALAWRRILLRERETMPPADHLPADRYLSSSDKTTSTPSGSADQAPGASS